MGSLFVQLLRAVLAFAAVLGLVYLASRYVKNYWPGARASGAFELSGALQVGPKSRLVAVRYGDRTYLLGVSETGVNLIDVELGGEES